MAVERFPPLSSPLARLERLASRPSKRPSSSPLRARPALAWPLQAGRDLDEQSPVVAFLSVLSAAYTLLALLVASPLPLAA